MSTPAVVRPFGRWSSPLGAAEAAAGHRPHSQVFPDEGHTFRSPRNRATALRTELDFLGRCLGLGIHSER